MFEKMAGFGDDHVGGANFLKAHFDEIPEPVKSEVYEAIMGRYDEVSQRGSNDRGSAKPRV